MRNVGTCAFPPAVARGSVAPAPGARHRSPGRSDPPGGAGSAGRGETPPSARLQKFWSAGPRPHIAFLLGPCTSFPPPAPHPESGRIDAVQGISASSQHSGPDSQEQRVRGEENRRARSSWYRPHTVPSSLRGNPARHRLRQGSPTSGTECLIISGRADVIIVKIEIKC